MSVRIRPYVNGGWEADIRLLLPDGTAIRERKKTPRAGKSAALRWAEARERVLLVQGKPKPIRSQEVQQKPTLKEFPPRWVDGYAKANRLKPSGIAAKKTVVSVHLITLLGRETDRRDHNGGRATAEGRSVPSSGEDGQQCINGNQRDA